MSDRDFQNARQHQALAAAMADAQRPRPAPQPIIPGLEAMGRAMAASSWRAPEPIEIDRAA